MAHYLIETAFSDAVKTTTSIEGLAARYRQTEGQERSIGPIALLDPPAAQSDFFASNRCAGPLRCSIQALQQLASPAGQKLGLAGCWVCPHRCVHLGLHVCQGHMLPGIMQSSVHDMHELQQWLAAGGGRL